MHKLLAILFVACTMCSFAQQPPAPRSVSVEGEAETYVAPDRGSITLGVETEGQTASAVKADNDKRVAALFQALKKAGIDEKDIQTSSLSLAPVYNYKTDGKREFLKYMMRNTVHVTVRNLSKLDRTIDACVDAGGNVIEDIGFSVTNAKELRDSIRVQAVKDAKRKAEAIAQAVGSQLGKPLALSAQDAYNPPVPMYKARMMSADAEGGGSTTSGGQMAIRVTVSATFELQ